MAKATQNKLKKYMIIPRNDDIYKEKYAVANTRKLPFETPVMLAERDIKALEGQREPVEVDSKMTVMDIMDKYQVDQKKAAEIAAAQATHPEIGGKSIKWRPKYILQAV